MAARRILIDALGVLAPHHDALVLVGAQAIYLRAGPNSLPIADYTTDSDVTLDPSALLDEPALEGLMREAGFELVLKRGAPEPGIWAAERIDEIEAGVTVELAVPAAVAPRRRRGALRAPHGKRAARTIVGLEAALIDNEVMDVPALDPRDGRSVAVRVAGVPALLVAKTHKLSDRLEAGKEHRLDDKDAADVVRLILAADAAEVASILAELCEHPTAGSVTQSAIGRFDELFGSRAGQGIEMAARSLRLGMPEERVRAICLDYARTLSVELPPR